MYRHVHFEVFIGYAIEDGWQSIVLMFLGLMSSEQNPELCESMRFIQSPDGGRGHSLSEVSAKHDMKTGLVVEQ